MKNIIPLNTTTSNLIKIITILLITCFYIFAQDTKELSDEAKGQEILTNQVKYSLNYIGLRLCDPIPAQDENTIVYRLSFKNITDKILQPIQQVLTQNNLKAGELVKFPEIVDSNTISITIENILGTWWY